MSETNLLLQPTDLGPYKLSNRIFLPPLTRSRTSQPGDVPNDIMATYYKQRAQAGLLITEGIVVEPRGRGFAWTPGIYTQKQIDGWKKVTQAVHEEKGVIFAQLWHVGRVSHSALQPDNKAPIAPSSIQAQGVKAFIATGPQKGELVDPELPRALTNAEVKELIGLYSQAAKNAKEAGFDGVELHSANGYLINQFISAHSNHREDEYGGSLANRLRFMKEVIEALVDVFGADKVGIRFSPLFTHPHEERIYVGMVEANPHETYIEAIKILQKIGIAYVSIAEADWDKAPDMPEGFRKDARKNFTGKILCAGRYDSEKGQKLLASGYADMIGFGRPFIANPDLVSRIKHHAPWNPVDLATMYSGDAHGYIDYPVYDKK